MSASIRVSPQELVEAARILAHHLDLGNIYYSISGGAAGSLLLQSAGANPRVTNDIDLVIHPANGYTAETVATWLYTHFPNEFGHKLVFGYPVPVLRLPLRRGGTKDIEIEIFDVDVWPNRQQYNLASSDNEVVALDFSGQAVNVFGGRWQLREKIVTAFERQQQQKHETDLNDVVSLLEVIPGGSSLVDLSHRPEAVQFVVDRLPQQRTSLEFLVHCPEVLGEPWQAVGDWFWRVDGTSNVPVYLDDTWTQHEFTWEAEYSVWCMNEASSKTWFLNAAGALQAW